jgi:hypothetical protein
MRPDIKLIGVEAELYPSMFNLLKHEDRAVGGDTLAEGIAVFQPGKFTSAVLRDTLDDFVLVSEHQIEGALALLLQIEKTVVEGAAQQAGGAGLSELSRPWSASYFGRQYRHAAAANVLLRDLPAGPAGATAVLQDRPARCCVSKVFYVTTSASSRSSTSRFTSLPGHRHRDRMRGARHKQLNALIDALRAGASKSARWNLSGATPSRPAAPRFAAGPAPPQDICAMPATPGVSCCCFQLSSRQATQTARSARGGKRRRDGACWFSPLFRDQPAACLSSGRATQGFHGTEGRMPCAERYAGPDRISAQPDGRLSPVLPRLHRLRFGARGGKRVAPRPRRSAT